MKRQTGLLMTLLAISLSVQAEQQPAGNTGTATGQMTEAAGFSPGTVVRSAFTTAVENREPTDNLETASPDLNQLYFFTELRDMAGQTAIHRWEYQGKVMAEVEFDVKGPRWRVWSSKTFHPGWAGEWKVSVVNAVGDVIKQDSFTYTASSASQAPQAAPATSVDSDSSTGTMSSKGHGLTAQ